MAYVLPTFVVMGFGYYVAETALERPLPRQELGLVRLRARRLRVGDGGAHRLCGPGDRALHLLPAADRQPLLLHRARARRRRLVDLVRPDDARHGGSGRRRTRARPCRSPCSRRSRTPCCGCGRRSASRRSSCSRSFPPRSAWNASIDVGLVAHAVLLDAARDRLFLADPGLHRLLHHGAAGRGRAALQRHHGAAHLHPVPDLQPAGRHPSPVHGPASTRTPSSSCR